MMTHLGAAWDRMRATYWAVPSAMATVAVVMSLVIIHIDQVLAARLVSQLSWVYTGGAEGARAVLSTIAASMITVAGVAFSITIVALTLASQQFGPRLLHNFLRDRGNQITLGTFVATYLYCVLVLRTVRGSDNEQFVPHIAVTIAVLLAMLSIGVLIYFIHHIATSIQASEVMANVAHDLEGTIDRLFPERIGHGGGKDAASTDEVGERDFSDAHVVVSTGGGYVQVIDEERLMEVARRNEVVVRVDAKPGSFVRSGSSLASVVATQELDGRFDSSLRDAFILGPARTGTQDLGFFVQQLVELALRALSPGINDPGTARACIDRLEEGLCRLSARKLPSACRYDDNGALRVVARPVTVAEMVTLAFTELSRYAHAGVAVRCRLLEALRNLASCVSREDDRQALARQAALIGERTVSPPDDDIDRTELADCYRDVLRVLANSVPRQRT